MIIQRILRQSSKFSHLSSSNQVNMVDISNKKFQKRTARAQCYLKISPEISQELKKLSNPDKSSVQNNTSIITKGDVFTTAKLAGIQAAKMTSNLIPLCHPINLTHVEVEIEHVQKTENNITELFSIFLLTEKCKFQMRHDFQKIHKKQNITILCFLITMTHFELCFLGQDEYIENRCSSINPSNLLDQYLENNNYDSYDIDESIPIGSNETSQTGFIATSKELTQKTQQTIKALDRSLRRPRQFYFGVITFLCWTLFIVVYSHVALGRIISFLVNLLVFGRSFRESWFPDHQSNLQKIKDYNNKNSQKLRKEGDQDRFRRYPGSSKYQPFDPNNDSIAVLPIKIKIFGFIIDICFLKYSEYRVISAGSGFLLLGGL